jgi:hypothetical protein
MPMMLATSGGFRAIKGEGAGSQTEAYAREKRPEEEATCSR